MSQILLALKQLEENSHAANMPHVAKLPTSTETHQLLCQTAWHIRQRNKLITAGVFLLVAVNACVFYFGRQVTLPTPQSFPIVVPAEMQAPLTAKLHPKIEHGRSTPDVVFAAAQFPPPPSTDSLIRQLSAESNVSRLSNDLLTVQAIAWSVNAGNRMAVINNRVLREGAKVEGFSIVRITEKAVFVREDEQFWQVPFGRP